MATKDVAVPGGLKLDAESVAVAYHAIITGELPEGFGSGGGDSEAMAREIAQRIIDSDSFEEAFGESSLVSWRDSYLDVPVQVKDMHLNPSTVQGGGGALYAVVDILPLDGSVEEPVTVTCGGRNVLAQLVKLFEKGWQERPVKLVANRTSDGYDALRLVAA